MNKLKFCNICNKNITIQNFTTHKKTLKHNKNLVNIEKVDLLGNNKIIDKDINYYKLQLEEIIKSIENILKW